MSIKFYEISHDYIDYLSKFAPHLFHNKKERQTHERKYIGIILAVNGLNYFAPLSSFKSKHMKMQETVDLIKLKNCAVINLNNMFPTPLSECAYVDISKEQDLKYRALLLAEYKIIKKLSEKILKNAAFVYKHKKENGNNTSLAKRCNDFALLEKACDEYSK